MPLPDRWDGTFYSKETSGDLLFDLSPQGFVAFILAEYPGEEFLIAGAICDLFWNRQIEIASKMLQCAMAGSRDQPWEALPIIVLTAKQILKSGADRAAVGTGLNNMVSGLFRGGISIHAYSPQPAA